MYWVPCLVLEVLDTVDDTFVAELLLVLPTELDDRLLRSSGQVHLG